MTRARIILYNPRASFFTMPLALLAVGSAIDRSRYEVIVIDGRLEADPIGCVLAATDGAVCLGITVLTGVPIRDALAVTRAVRAARPECRIVWGGWHPSLFPLEALSESGVDAIVVGQGEETFREVVERFAARDDLRGVAGTVAAPSTATTAPLVNPSRQTRDLNELPAHDYGLLDLSRYFRLKGAQQLDYVTSQGCRFRCAFCADPTVYGRAWFGLAPARVGDELEFLMKGCGFTDVAFQDETFFTHSGRVAAMAEQFLARGLRFSWMATLRADQGARLDDSVLGACRHAGLRRVMVGLESGSQAMLDWMKKDIKLAQVFETAEKCRRHGIGVLFNLIVGFPDEPLSSVYETLEVAKKLRAFGPDFQVALFRYRPYPGTAITDELVKRGVALPRTLQDWAAIEDGSITTDWMDLKKRSLIDRFSFYQRIGWAASTPLRRPVQAIARWRCRTDRYALPVEKVLAEWLRPSLAS